MVTFIIIRHGYSQGNKEKRFSGQLDVPLDDIGVLQAKSVAEYVLENFKVDSIYSSDLSRAYETVKPIGDVLGLEVQKCKELREVDVGKWQGKLVEDIKKEDLEGFESYRTNPGLFIFEGGESYIAAMERAALALDKIARENEGKTVVIGTHGGIVRTLRASWNNIPAEGIKDIPHVLNASVTVAEYDKGNVRWLQIGYSDHLADKVTEQAIK